MDRLLTTEEVAKYLRVDVVTVRRLVSRGELTAYRIGSEYRFREEDIERYVSQQRVSGPDAPVENEASSWLGKMAASVRGKDRDRFDRFTDRARRVLALAQQEAQRFQHNYIGTEHLLLGLIAEGEGVAGKVLANMGVSLERARAQVEFIIGRGNRIVLGEIGLTPRAKKVIELAVDEARRLGHHYIGTEHLLLGMVREGEGIAAGVLESLGVTMHKAREQLLKVLSQMEAERAATTPLDDEPLAGEPSAAEAEAFPHGADRFDKFTERARRVLSLAHEEAQRFQHNYIGTEHLLLGLVREESGIASKVLRARGVTVEKLRKAIEFIIGHSKEEVQTAIGLTPRARKVIELAVDEAKSLGHQYVGTEHILLGIMREGEGIGAKVLPNLGVDPDELRNQILKILAHIQATRAAMPPTPEVPEAPEAPEAPAASEAPAESSAEKAPAEPAAPPPPVPTEAASLLPEGEAGRTCSKCGARSPSYFNHCFNCGEKL